MSDDLELAFLMVDAADAITSGAWTPAGVTAVLKADGSPVTEADLAAALHDRRAPAGSAP